jgi:ADP-ribose pyrophosphatase YjhB (NUDIX family)
MRYTKKMKYLKTIKDADIFKNPEFKEPSSYDERETVKLIIENNKGEIALVTNPIHKLYLFPGGGAESSNLKKEAEREALEEINYHVEIKKELGKTEEFRNRDAKHYVTTFFFAKTVREGEGDSRTDEEKANGLKVCWFPQRQVFEILSQQAEKVKRGEVKYYNIAFNIVRDHFLLNHWASQS